MCERPVAFPVTDRRAPVAAYPSLLTAGAYEAEADTPDGIATNPSVIDAERDPLYGDRVVRHITFGEWQREHEAVQQWRRESLRQSRLSRWQEQR